MKEQQQAEKPSSSSEDTSPFPVVGIGASAGGLAALIRLLENMPPAPGMALVVVLHLASDLPSAADRLLQRATDMPVVQVAERMRLRPNQVYVIAPGRSLKMEDGQLIADKPQCALGVPMTINIFFRTLAEAHGEAAIGVLLSGMGSDGVAGLGSIKEHGGLTIAQLPADAEETGMPQAAIDSGMVDVVLPAAQVPSRLLAMRDAMRCKRQRGLSPCGMGAHAEETLDAILALLCARTGHDFRHYKESAVLPRVERRMQAKGVADLPAYVGLLQEDLREPDALLQELLVGTTNFFRDRDAFHVLEKSIMPRIFHERKPGQPLRAWVTGCSTGEEAYSLAMLLAEHAEEIGGGPAMQIFATDGDERALAVARAGRYPGAIAADVAPERLARYFLIEDDHFRVSKLLRERILFARHDLQHDPAFSGLDLIICRNVLLYLNREVHRHILEVFHGALNPGGYLFLGGAESVELAPDLFVAVNPRHRLYQARPATKAVRRLSMPPANRVAGREIEREMERQPAPPAAAHGQARMSSLAELHQRTLAQLAPPSVLVNGKGEIVHACEGAAAFLRYGGGEPSTQVLALVLPGLRAELRTAMFRASASRSAARFGPVRYEQDGRERAVSLSVVPLQDIGDARDGDGMLLVQFESAEPAPSTDPGAAAAHPRVRELEDALALARQDLRQAIEQAELSNAQLRQSNQALQGTVDELRTYVDQLEIQREEMQSRSEELYTVNAELQLRVDETSDAHDALSNLIASTDIATLFLDHRLRIQRYTPQVTRIFNVIPADVGRPLIHITNRLGSTPLLDEVIGVLGDEQPIERELRSTDGRDYIVRVHPYRTAYGRVEGAVLTFFDITGRRAAEKALQESEQRLALAFAALPVGICTIDTAGNTVMLNEVMRRFMPTGAIPSRDPARTGRWHGWDATGMPVAPRDFPGARALRGESLLSGMQMLYLDDDGKETWTEVRSAPLRDNEGNITGALVVVIDVDRLKRAEEEARANAQRQAFLLRLSDAMRAERDADAVANRVLRMLCDEMRLDRCCILSCRTEQDLAEVTHQAGSERFPALPGMLRLSAYPQALRAAPGQALVVDDAGGGDAGIGALLAARLGSGEDMPAWSLVAMGAAPRCWTRGEIALVEEVAERAWSAIGRARAEATAARAERRAESILERMDEAHCVLDRDYRIVGVNAAAERLLGRERSTLLGRSNWEAFPGSVDGPDGQAFRRVVEEGVEQHLTHHYTGEGYDLYIELDAYPTDEGGVAMFWREVSERVHAERALRASEEKYRALFNEMDEAYAVVEVIGDAAGRWTDFRFLEVNPVFMRHTGMPYPVGRTATELLGTPNPRWAELYGRAAETGEPIRVEEGELTLGRVFDLHIFRLGGGGSRRVAVLFNDITERKQAEAALRESEARFRALAEASPALIWQIDEHGALNYVNGRCLEVTGAGLDQLRGTGWHGVVHPDDAAGYLHAIERALRTQQGVQWRVRVRRGDGSHRWFESHALPWWAADGQFRGLVGISIDVDEAVQAAQALKMADRRKDEFLATLAHELRNPLAPISNALQFLRHPGGKRRADRLLAMVERQVRQMVRMVDDLMDVTRISRGKVDLHRAPVALAEVLRTAVETSLPAFEQKRQQLTIEAPDDSLRLDADKVRLVQVFANLLNNASKYTAPEGRAWLGVRRDGDEVVVTVGDTGMGIEQALLPVIFEMFSQPHGRGGHTESGLGIGLAMVRSLVELHGGSVEAHSDGPGQGSRFVVRLPLHDCPDAALGEVDGPIEQSPTLLAGRRILVVDDNRDAADSLCQLLAARGADARAVYDGRSAVEALASTRPHAIVLDIGMPDMDGYEVARRIRQDRDADGIRIIALSGWGQHADRQRSRACGFDHHLTKPAQLGRLLGMLSAP